MGREALESSSAAFQATAKPSQLPTHDSLLDSRHHFHVRPTKKPDVFVTPGLLPFRRVVAAECHKRSFSEGIFAADKLSRRSLE